MFQTTNQFPFAIFVYQRANAFILPCLLRLKKTRLWLTTRRKSRQQTHVDFDDYPQWKLTTGPGAPRCICIRGHHSISVRFSVFVSKLSPPKLKSDWILNGKIVNVPQDVSTNMGLAATVHRVVIDILIYYIMQPITKYQKHIAKVYVATLWYCQNHPELSFCLL